MSKNVNGHLIVLKSDVEEFGETCNMINSEEYLSLIGRMKNSNFTPEESLPLAVHLTIRTAYTNKVLTSKHKSSPEKEMTLSRDCLTVDTIGVDYNFFLWKLKEVLLSDFEKLKDEIIQNSVIKPLGYSINTSPRGERFVAHFVLYVRDEDMDKFNYKRNTARKIMVEDIATIYDSNNLSTYDLAIKEFMKVVPEKKGDS